MKPRKFTIKERIKMARIMAKILGSPIKFWNNKAIAKAIREYDRK